MSNELNKKIAQKGGMMIEALAMLGLIAVVTPTMYKKSAERTLEVEDINTATSMRSVMTAADSYVSSHYGELVQAMTADDQNTKSISMTELQSYLPYGFNADRLYDFKEPKVSVVRNGNNLTSFVIFPAKENGEDGLGQERTVRIATLVGANGGYVTVKNKSAKGIGGIWSLNSSEDEEGVKFSDVFPKNEDDDAFEVYSIVTASSDAINNTNTEEDSDKFLYRTHGDGRWHNTMRTDLYMGKNTYDDAENADELDGYYNEGTYSIRQVKSLIIGAEEASKHTVTDGEGNSKDVEDNYGLYVTGANPNSFIQGSLEAANSQFKVDENSLMYERDVDKFIIDSEGLRFGQVAEDAFSPKFTVTKAGDVTNEGSIKLGGVVKEGEEGVEPTYMIDGSNSSLNLMDERIYISGKDKTVNESLIINAGGTKGDGEDWQKEISYNTSPTFPVKVDSNMRVDGILATAQLDTQNIRAAELEVGSANIDDANKWLKVDANGIHGRNPAAVSGDANKTKTNTVFDVKDGEVNIATGTLERNGNNFDTSTGGANNSFRMTDSRDDAGVELATSKDGVNNSFALKNNGAYLVSNQNIDINLNDSTNVEENDNRDIKLRNTKIQEQIAGTDVVFSSLEKIPTTNVKIQKTNFQVSDTGGSHVLTVRGNNAGKKLDNFLDSEIGGDAFDVSVRGETIFSPKDLPKNKYFGYLSVGIPYIEQGEYGDYTGVSIAPFDFNDEHIVPTMAVDLNPNSTITYGSGSPKVESHVIDPGTVYVRSGMVEVMPTNEDLDMDKYKNIGAHEGHGFMAAGRFVANNLDKNGNEVKAPMFFTNKEFNKYNYGSDENNEAPTGRYDTYMVNPAYTSVMHDIKLTTRGGARLSDILPDFINKGIYVTSNTYKDTIKSLQFEIDSGGIKLAGTGNGTIEHSNDPITLGNSDSWASPYLGFVPAPQCPPGYNRLVTLSPSSFMMSQAGQMQRSATGQDHPRGGYAYYTQNQVPEDSAFTEYNNAMGSSNGQYIQQGFANVAVEDDAKLVNSSEQEKGVVTAQGGAPEPIKAKTKGLGLQTGHYNKDSQNNDIDFVPDAQQHPYFLVSYGDTPPPLTIQQSTWLKTNVIPVGEGTANIGTPGTGYIKGWAALMGFVYDAATYESIIDILKTGYKGSDNEIHKQNLIAYDGSENSVYWNVFPVRRSTLEAYATVYCYFDRNGIIWDEFSNKGHNEYIDHYNAVNDYKTNTYDKHRSGDNSNQDYLKRLNDPTLKYDEVW